MFKSRDSVLARPDGDPASALTVCPGAHRTGVEEKDSAASVVWWAPDALTLGVQAAFGLKRDDLIVKDVPSDALRTQLDAYRAWRARRDAALESGRVPSVRVSTVTEWASRFVDTDLSGSEQAQVAEVDAIEVTVETAGSGGIRPAGPRFGTLVHAVLADMPLDGSDEEIAGLVETHGRVLGATADELAEARNIASKVKSHPLMRAAALASSEGRCYRETPVTWRSGDGALVEGNVDLVYVTADEAVIVDFKTDRELDGSLEVYRRQVQIYAAAVGRALERRARGVLLRV
jgi:ATP-dependent exoDNAse (exonuclease V) beta subunit